MTERATNISEWEGAHPDKRVVPESIRTVWEFDVEDRPPPTETDMTEYDAAMRTAREEAT